LTGGKTVAQEMGGDPSGGSYHRVYRAADGRLTIEWEESRDPAPYDHADTIVFDGPQESLLRVALGESDPARDMASVIADRFETYWAVRKFADAHGITYEHHVDFSP
jgi:hypothetical protein